MQKIFGDEKPSLEDLVHHGVKGMRWGQHIKDHGPSNHQLNKASRQRDRATRKQDTKDYNAERNAMIDKARERVNSGATRREFKEAKSAAKAQKKQIGSREVRKKINDARTKRDTDYHNAQLIKSGAETTGHIIGLVGGIALAGAVAGAQASRGSTGGHGYTGNLSRPAPYRTTAYVGRP